MQNQRIEAEARFEKLWRQRPEQFDPMRNVMERERIERTWDLLKTLEPFEGKRIVDLGCGTGTLALRLSEAGGIVDAIDIASLPLERLKNKKNITPIQAWIPQTTLPDNAYDIVLCTDLIAYLPKEQFRLLFSEMARLIKPEGHLVCSTPIDIQSEDALQRFCSLTETEFHIEKGKVSHHRLWIRLHHKISISSNYVQAAQDPSFKKDALREKTGLAKKWFLLNTSYPLLLFHRLHSKVFTPLTSLFRNWRSLLICCESFSRFFWSNQGISHAILLGKRRSLFEPPSEPTELELKLQKRIWE